MRKVGVKEKEVVRIQNDTELRPKFKKSHQDFLLTKISSIVEHGRDVLYYLPNVICSRMGFRAVAFFLSKQRNRRKFTESGDLQLVREFQSDAEKLMS